MNTIITIDRDRLINPATDLDIGWTVSEQDNRSLALTQVDLTQVVLKTCLKKDESYITSKERLQRLKQMKNRIRLDAMVLRALWQSGPAMPEAWKERVNGKIQRIHFDGTVGSNSTGDFFTDCLFWDDGYRAKQWTYYWDRWVDHCQNQNFLDLSALLVI